MMPELLSETRADGAVTCRLRVPPALLHFAGHFPGCAILPGVVQVDWAVRLARRYFDRLDDSYGLDAFKCRAPVLPGAELTLRLECDPARRSLLFSYADAARTVSSGKVLFR